MSDFKKIKISNVEFKYPRLDKLYRYDATIKNEETGKMGKSVASEPDEQGSNWSCGFHLPKERSTALWDKCVAHFRDRQGSKIEFKTIAGSKEQEDGSIVFRAKRNAKNKKGQLSEQPKILNGNGKELENKAILSGSRGNITVGIFPANNPNAGGMGISMWLLNVEVTDPQYGYDDAEDLDDVNPEVGLITDDFDDEIPF